MRLLPLAMIAIGAALLAGAVWNVKLTDLLTGAVTPKGS